MKEILIGVKIPEKLKQQLKISCAKKCISLKDLCIQLFEEYLKNNKEGVN